MKNLVIARYRDGHVVKGVSFDVDPAKPTCHVRPDTGAVMEVRLADLKALFFVKTLEGNSKHDEGAEVATGDRRTHGSAMIVLTFEDGEKLTCLTNRFPPNRPFYFVVPVDLESNNVRILVNAAAVASFENALDPAKH
ncbi:MAG: hypothetical protein ABI679_09025 [Gemmatimonadota bacterium]